VIRYSSIGDIVLTFPLLKIIKERHPDIVIDYLTSEKFIEVFSLTDKIDNLFTGRNLWGCLKIIKRGKYDVIIDLHRKPITLLLSILLFTCEWRRYEKKSIDKILQVLKVKGGSIPPVYLRYAWTWDRNITDEEVKRVVPYLRVPVGWEATLAKYELKKGEYVVVNMGGSYSTKRLSPLFVETMLSCLDVPVVIVGGKDVIHDASQIKNKGSGLNLVGKTSLIEAFGIVYGSRCVISGDSALSHVSCGFGIPTVVVYSSTVAGAGMVPLAHPENLLIVENRNLWCRPCTIVGSRRCPAGHFMCGKVLPYSEIFTWLRGKGIPVKNHIGDT